MAEEIDISLDPKKVVDALGDMSKEIKQLAETIERSLGKEAPKSINKLEDAAEKGSSKITSIFKDLGKRVKEDLKSAFAVGEVLGGVKMAKDLGEGIKSVFEMERAFAKLNTRLKLTSDQLQEFKRNVGSRVASTGQRLQDILPGVETAAAKGGIKSPEQLAAIAESLGKAKTITGEDTAALSDTIVEILKNSGQKINAQTFSNTMNALQGTRTAGAFGSAEEAGQGILELSKYSKQLGLNTRQLGGLAATSSQAGPGGMDILNKLLEKATTIGGASVLNATLGQHVFKAGAQGQAVGMNAEALSKVNFGKLSPQVLEQITGLSGASGNDLKRFIDSFKNNMGNMKQVVQGANETADQFKEASNNMSFEVDKFKRSAEEATRQIGGAFSQMGSDLLHGNFGKLKGDISKTGQVAGNNAGYLAGALGVTALAGLMMGGGMNQLLKKVPGIGMAGGIAGGEAAKAAGITPVYVVNAKEIGSGNALAGAAGIGGKLGAIAGVGGAAALGYEIGNAIMNIGAVKSATGSATDKVYNAIMGNKDKALAESAKMNQMEKGREDFNKRNNMNLSFEEYSRAVTDGTLKAYKQQNIGKVTQHTNPSAYPPRGH